MKKFNLLVLLAVVVKIFSACQKEDEMVDSSQKPSLNLESENSILAQGMTVLGKKLENPYSLENMRKALSLLESTGQLKSVSLDSSDIQPTDLYVRFLPKNDQELDLIKRDTLLDFYDYPLDYEIENPGTYYHDPSLPDTAITWQYTVVPPNYNFPPVEHEVLAQLFMLEDGADTTSLKSAHLGYLNWVALENKALEITNNLDEESKTGNVLKRSRWQPKGRIMAWDNVKRNFISLEGVYVRARRWDTTHTGYTDSNGFFACGGTFKRPANYSIIWERADWDIRNGTIGQAYYNGPKMTGDWNLNINKGGKSIMYATIHSAAYNYYNKNPFGTHLPPENKWYRSSIKIGYYDKDGSSLGDYAKWRNWLTWPQIRIYGSASGTTRTTTEIYATTSHELAHAEHWQLIVSAPGSNRNRDFNNAETKLVESWARGVQRQFTRYFIDSNYEPSYFGVYTPIVRDLLNLGYSLKELESALINANSLDKWESNIKNKYNKSYENQLDAIFSRY